MCVCRESSHFCAPKGQHLLILISECRDLLCVDWCKCPRSVSSVCVCWCVLRSQSHYFWQASVSWCNSLWPLKDSRGSIVHLCQFYIKHFSKKRRSEAEGLKTTANLPRSTRPLKVRLHQIMPIDCSSLWFPGTSSQSRYDRLTASTFTMNLKTFPKRTHTQSIYSCSRYSIGFRPELPGKRSMIHICMPTPTYTLWGEHVRFKLSKIKLKQQRETYQKQPAQVMPRSVYKCSIKLWASWSKCMELVKKIPLLNPTQNLFQLRKIS